MKIENQNSTCTCDSYKNMTIKYGSMLDEYFKANEVLRNELITLQEMKITLNNLSNSYMQEVINLEAERRTLELEIQNLKDYIKYSL